MIQSNSRPRSADYERRMNQIKAARLLLANGSARLAAAYMRVCGWSLEGCLYLLLGKESRDHSPRA